MKQQSQCCFQVHPLVRAQASRGHLTQPLRPEALRGTQGEPAPSRAKFGNFQRVRAPSRYLKPKRHSQQDPLLQIWSESTTRSPPHRINSSFFMCNYLTLKLRTCVIANGRVEPPKKQRIKPNSPTPRFKGEAWGAGPLGAPRRPGCLQIRNQKNAQHPPDQIRVPVCAVCACVRACVRGWVGGCVCVFCPGPPPPQQKMDPVKTKQTRETRHAAATTSGERRLPWWDSNPVCHWLIPTQAAGSF